MNYIDAIRIANNESKYDILINGNLNVENAVMIFKNFAGNSTRFNPQGGKRTFSLVVSPEMAARLDESGWNVKVKEVRDQLNEGEQTQTVGYADYMASHLDSFDHAMFYTEIVVNEHSEYPPKIYRVSEFDGEKTMALVPPQQWKQMDESELVNVDLVIHPYNHGRNIANPDAKKGYLKTMYATMVAVNDFGGKYAGYSIVGE